MNKEKESKDITSSEELGSANGSNKEREQEGERECR